MATENVTVLFTDMVDSTAIGASMPPTDADEFRRIHFGILRQAMAETGGVEVKNLGDGVMAVFTSASTAIACAVAMQQGIERDNRGRDRPVGLRVGLSSGEATLEDGDYFGDPVIEAARICALCDRGEILAADVVRLTAGRRSVHPTTPRGEHTLKGLPDPVDLVEVVWHPDDGEEGDRIPIPHRLSHGPTLGMFGRELEVAAAIESFKRIESTGGCEVLLVGGEAGLGKTTLVAAAARAAYESGATVLFGHCEEELASPYKLFSEALGHAFTHLGEDDIDAIVAATGGDLARLVPPLGRRRPDLPRTAATDADSERFMFFASVVAALGELSRDRPVVLVLDDLQWADRSSLQLLVHLVTSVHPMRVLVLGTYRDNELSRAHPLLETIGLLHRHSTFGRIELTGLNDLGVLSIMEAAAGHALDDPALTLARAVYRETDGNPYFVTEVLRHLSESGVIFLGPDQRWTTSVAPEEIALPDSVREVIGTRVGRLGPTADDVLSIAAVIGRDFDLDLLCAATERTEDEVLDVLEAAARSALVDESANRLGHYSFRHALVQHTLYQELGPTRRARAHRRVAVALEDLVGSRSTERVGELARHWAMAVRPVDMSKAIEYSRRAGDAALESLAPDDAASYYGQALDMLRQSDLDDALLELDLMIGLGTAQRQVGEPGFREVLLDASHRAQELGDTDRLVAAALANSRGWSSAIGVVDRDKVRVLEECLAVIPGSDAARALVLATLCAELCWGTPLERRQELADEAVRLAAATDDDATIVRVLNSVALPLGVPHLIDQSLERTAEALRRAERLGDPVLLLFAAMWRAQTMGLAGDIDERDRCYALAGSLADRLGEPTLTWSRVLNQSVEAMTVGDIGLVTELATAAMTIGTESGQPDALSYFGIGFKLISWMSGTLGALVPEIEGTRDLMSESPSAVDATLALAHAEAGDVDQARALLDRYGATGFGYPIDHSWLTTTCDFAEAAVESDAHEWFGGLYDLLRPFGALVACTGTSMNGPVALALAGLGTALGRFDEAASHLAVTDRYVERYSTRFVGARADLCWGRLALADPGADRSAAAIRVRSAVEAGRSHGYSKVAERAAAVLARLDGA
jgi:class 3 adenylate cyclase